MSINAGNSKNNVSHRRDFLKQSGISLTAMSLATTKISPLYAQTKKIRLGVVGGGFGTSFQWHEHPDCVVEAVSDLRPERRERLMKTYHCQKSYPSLEELVKDPNIDAVAVFTDGPLHVEHVEECMKHGKHVISAVPASLGGGIEEAERLLDVVKSTGLTYMMAETSYYQQKTISARSFIRREVLGIFITVNRNINMPVWKTFIWKMVSTGGMVLPQCTPTHCTALSSV